MCPEGRRKVHCPEKGTRGVCRAPQSCPSSRSSFEIVPDPVLIQLAQILCPAFVTFRWRSLQAIPQDPVQNRRHIRKQSHTICVVACGTDHSLQTTGQMPIFSQVERLCTDRAMKQDWKYSAKVPNQNFKKAD